MKKTSKSPENIEITPSKKKLKQARLPFMLISDVSPKAETLPSRKRKLSVPDPEPVTKVGKISKENNISEELVIVSDEDSKPVPSPQNEDKPVNPFVKLVDTAWKKKLQKSKGKKKSKTRSSKRQKPASLEKQASIDSSECDDVEMVDVDVIIHENGERDNNETHKNKPNGKAEPHEIENNNKPQNKKNTQPQPIENKPKQSLTKNTKEMKPNDNEVVCLDDSNNSSDINMSQPNDSKDIETVTEQKVQSTAEVEKKSTQNIISKQKVNRVTPKRSSRNTSKKQNQKLAPSDEHTSQSNDKLKEKSTNSPKNSNTVESQESTKETQEVEPKSKSPKKMPTPKRSGGNEDKDISASNNSNAESTNNKDKVESSSKASETDNSDEEMIEIPEDSTNSPTKSDSTDSTKPDDKTEDNSKSTKAPVTPKRSARNKNKEEANKLNESTTSLLDESMTSNPSTPKNNKSLSDNGLADTSINESTKNLTPKQLQKRLESAKKREEREKEKQEREKKRQQEKEDRAKQRQEKEEQKRKEREEKEEAKKKEKEEKEEQRKKEKEEKEKQKEMEKKAKELKEEQKRKEREDKEEQRRKEKEAREEERRKKQEALELEKQEQELKKKKAAEAFVNFFVPKQKVEKELSTGPVSKNSMLSSFTIKVDMRLAPTCRVYLSDEKREVLDKYLDEPNPDNNYLKCLKNGLAKPLSSGKTWPLDEKDDDVMIVEDELPPIDGSSEVITCESAPREKLRPKLLSFHENRRPPYWGTWRKKSAFVKPRRPFGQDQKQLEYEVDSDDDWEDEQDGESLDGSAGGSDDEAGADDYEVDNEVFVPHGYLSDEEATMDEDDVMSLSPETQKARLKHLEDEFESELKKPTEKLKPRLYGLLWESPEGGKPEKCVDALWNYFQKFAMIMNDPTPLLQPSVELESSVSDKKKVKKKKVLPEGETKEQSPKSEKKKKLKPENKESKKPKPDAKKTLPNQPGINSFLQKVKDT